uniref:Uncharacterized protein n=1 Tax=Acrobeloides nanus TaxID=290746 RepID=A0A914E4P1_9BILA
MPSMLNQETSMPNQCSCAFCLTKKEIQVKTVEIEELINQPIDHSGCEDVKHKDYHNMPQDQALKDIEETSDAKETPVKKRRFNNTMSQRGTQYRKRKIVEKTAKLNEMLDELENKLELLRSLSPPKVYVDHENVTETYPCYAMACELPDSTTTPLECTCFTHELQEKFQNKVKEIEDFIEAPIDMTGFKFETYNKRPIVEVLEEIAAIANQKERERRKSLVDNARSQRQTKYEIKREHELNKMIDELQAMLTPESKQTFFELIPVCAGDVDKLT